MNILAYGLLGFIVLAGTAALYFGRGGGMPTSLREYADFGTYVAGVSGPLLSFVALIAVARTLQLNRDALDLDREKQLADQHLRWLDALYVDMTDALDAEIGPGTPLRAVLDRRVEPESINANHLRVGVENLLKLVAQYCSAVDMYRDNVSEFYDLKIYVDRGGRLLDGIKSLQSFLGVQSLPTIEFCDMHLRGESERSTPEAMTRSSRP